jgi:hypothetical protein
MFSEAIKEYAIFNSDKPFSICLSILQFNQRFNNKVSTASKISRYLSDLLATSATFADSKIEYVNFMNNFEVFLFRNYGLVKYHDMIAIKSLSIDQGLFYQNHNQDLSFSLLDNLVFNPLKNSDLLISLIKYFNNYFSITWVVKLMQIICFCNC